MGWKYRAGPVRTKGNGGRASDCSFTSGSLASRTPHGIGIREADPRLTYDEHDLLGDKAKTAYIKTVSGGNDGWKTHPPVHMLVREDFGDGEYTFTCWLWVSAASCPTVSQA